MRDSNTPVLVGVGQVTERDPDLDTASSPLDLMEQAALLATEDADLSREKLAHLDALVVMETFREYTRNPPESLAARLGAQQASAWLMCHGGNGPQFLVNYFSEEISKGNMRFVLLAGAEAMDTARRLTKSGNKPNWSIPSHGDAQYLIVVKQKVGAECAGLNSLCELTHPEAQLCPERKLSIRHHQERFLSSRPNP